jgi:hypothetical protein
MAEGVQTADGKPLNIDPAAAADAERQFAQAMAAPGPDDKSVPPKRAARERVEDGPARARSARAPRTPKGGKAPSASHAEKAPPTHSEIVTAVQGLVQVPAAICLMLSKRAKDPVPLMADAVVLASNAEQIGEACAKTAEVDEKFAAVMAKVASAGPYAALVSVTFAVAGQIARNHGMPVPGTEDPRDLVGAASSPAHAGGTDGS